MTIPPPYTSAASAAAGNARTADAAAHWARLIFFIAFAVWVGRHMREPEPLLHGSLLIFHEAGHVLFMPFGEFLMVLGGSLFQLLVPAFFVVYFIVRRDRFSACFAALYLAASFTDVAVYIADARAGDLPLIGGADRSNHDWTFLLIELGRLEQDTAIGGTVHRIGVLLYWFALAAGLWFWWLGRQPPLTPPIPEVPARAEPAPPTHAPHR